MVAKDAKVGHFYFLENGDVFLTSYPDSVKDCIHVWYYHPHDYFYDKHLFYDVEIEEIYPEHQPRYVIMHIFNEDDYFARNF